MIKYQARGSGFGLPSLNSAYVMICSPPE